MRKVQVRQQEDLIAARSRASREELRERLIQEEVERQRVRWRVRSGDGPNVNALPSSPAPAAG